MGYRLKRKTLLLEFQGDLEGLTIKASSMSFGMLLELGDQTDRIRAGAGLGAVRELVEAFTSRIQEWNVEDEITGEILPITMDAFLSMDMDVAGAALRAWLDAMTNVDESLGKGSTSGPPSAPVNFPMEAP